MNISRQMAEAGITWKIHSFSAAEAEAITGVSQIVQRDWRRRKIIGGEAVNGRVRYAPIELAAIILLKAFSDAGLPLSMDAKTWFFAVQSIDAFAAEGGGAVISRNVNSVMEDCIYSIFRFEQRASFMIFYRPGFDGEECSVLFNDMDKFEMNDIYLHGGFSTSFSIIGLASLGMRIANSRYKLYSASQKF
ncbi:hypothetical protein ACN2C7_06505 [Caulobacter sp. ErkDOM-E]|uniref:hypothetical protein n=1 Tax=Caulobacter sp. ErkDOM-E TaxID=3402778 RepID=UPI003AF7F349